MSDLYISRNLKKPRSKNFNLKSKKRGPHQPIGGFVQKGNVTYDLQKEAERIKATPLSAYEKDENFEDKWRPDYNRPVGDIGRKLMLKDIREFHSRDPAWTTEQLSKENLEYSAVRFMTVTKLYHYMYALGAFEYALKISFEFGSNQRKSLVYHHVETLSNASTQTPLDNIFRIPNPIYRMNNNYNGSIENCYINPGLTLFSLNNTNACKDPIQITKNDMIAIDCPNYIPEALYKCYDSLQTDNDKILELKIDDQVLKLDFPDLKSNIKNNKRHNDSYITKYSHKKRRSPRTSDKYNSNNLQNFHDFHNITNSEDFKTLDNCEHFSSSEEIANHHTVDNTSSDQYHYDNTKLTPTSEKQGIIGNLLIDGNLNSFSINSVIDISNVHKNEQAINTSKPTNKPSNSNRQGDTLVQKDDIVSNYQYQNDFECNFYNSQIQLPNQDKNSNLLGQISFTTYPSHTFFDPFQPSSECNLGTHFIYDTSKCLKKDEFGILLDKGNEFGEQDSLNEFTKLLFPQKSYFITLDVPHDTNLENIPLEVPYDNDFTLSSDISTSFLESLCNFSHFSPLSKSHGKSISNHSLSDHYNYMEIQYEPSYLSFSPIPQYQSNPPGFTYKLDSDYNIPFEKIKHKKMEQLHNLDYLKQTQICHETIIRQIFAISHSKPNEQFDAPPVEIK